MAKSASMKHLETNVYAKLDEFGWTVTDLADAVGMDRSALSKIIRGVNSPSLETLDRIAAGLQCESFELLQPRQLVG